MDETILLRQLEKLGQSIKLEVRYDRPGGKVAFVEGGLCRIKDKQVIIINKTVSTSQKIRILVRELRRFDLSNIYIIPALRDLLEKRT